ncbi:MAG: HEAT repeat domain-containing protein, partial [Acidobacteria bacterium]|nr:HEAT repeat domain-containing protein [Acidobacteriota bacterium]
DDGADDFQYRLLGNARAYFKEDREKYRRSIVENVYTDPMDVFDRHLYPKGGWTLHMLRGVVGEDLFWKTIRTYAREHFAGVVTTEDLRATFEKVTGRGLVWFFDQWYHHGGHPEFRVRQEWDEAQGAVRLEVEQVQEVDRVTPLFRMPVRLEFSGDSWSREFRIEVSREREEFTFPLPEPPLMTRFDAGQFLLKKLEFQRSLTELVYQMEHDSDAAGRIWAAEQMGQRAGQRQSAQGLLEALRREPFWGVRIEIAKAMGKLHLPVSFDTLLETAGGDPDSRVRAAALAALGKYHGDAAGAGAIRASFQSETNEYVRAAAVKAYAESGAEDAAAFLEKAVPISSHREVIATATYEGMAKLKDRSFLPTLRKGAAEGNGRRRREAAIKALGKMAAGEEMEEIVDLLIDLLGDPSVFAREAAIKALGTAGSPKAVPLLQAAALNEYDSRLRRAARASVEKIRDSGGSGQGLAKLQERIDNLEAETRQLREELERDSGEIAKVQD